MDNNFIVHPDKVLIQINPEDKRKIFEKDIKRQNGSVIKLIQDVEASQGEHALFTQSVKTGTIIAVGANVDWLFVGDRALMDYIVEADESFTLEGTSNKDKIVCVDARTSYHEEDCWAYANQRNSRDMPIYLKGELDRGTLLIGVIRDGKLIANPPYIILAYDEVKEYETAMPGGITAIATESIVEREVVVSHPKSPLKTGDRIIMEAVSFFDTVADDKKISVVFDHDIMLQVKHPITQTKKKHEQQSASRKDRKRKNKKGN